MKDIRKLVREHVKDNRFKMLIGIIIYSFVSVLISMLFQNFNLVVLGLIPTTIVSFVFLVQLYRYVDKVVNGKVVTLKDMFQPFTVERKYLVIAGSYVLWAAVSFILLFIIGRMPKLAPLALLIMIVLFVMGNAINHTFYFMNEEIVNISYMDSVKAVFKDSKLLFSSGIRTLTIILQGAILTVLVNVFAFAPQLDKILDMSDLDASTILIQQIFATNVSAFIQSVGIQTIMYYILFVSCITYGTYVRKNRIKLKK